MVTQKEIDRIKTNKHTHSTQNWLWADCPDFIANDQWPSNSPDLNPLDYHVWEAILQQA